MVSTGELIFWCVCGVLSLITMLAIPAITNYIERRDYEKKLDYSFNL